MGNDLMLAEPTQRQMELAEEQISGNCMPYLMDMQLSRNYLNNIQHPELWEFDVSGLNDLLGWMQIDRLPMDDENGHGLLRAWQSALSACHTLGLKVAFVLLRVKGQTKIYLGAINGDGDRGSACNVMKQCVSVYLPGAVLREQSADFKIADALAPAGLYTGVVTGIPSLLGKEDHPLAQTLDKLASGIAVGGSTKNYALVVIADPAKDAEIIQLQQKLLRIKSELHTLASYSEGQSENSRTNEGNSQTRRSGLAVILSMVQSASLISRMAGDVVGYAGMSLLSIMMGTLVGDKGHSATQIHSLTSSLTREHKDFTINHCEELIDKHIARMEGGRNLGFWQVGTYVLGEERETVDAVLALLRSVYSGSESYVEPIRVMNTSDNKEHLRNDQQHAFRAPAHPHRPCRWSLACAWAHVREFDNAPDHPGALPCH